jgi:hypothetical protein
MKLENEPLDQLRLLLLPEIERWKCSAQFYSETVLQQHARKT